ncbi:hypothetical protein [Adlercreutzia sp. ZJ138]|uniref:hypothetical protein n=1 Tax=Adlercreutzia sp. ZJ138 TaxID=2709405 RepID=UPI0013EC95FE|nr:hypothetical protein [Adlercreutzia sp. ZJ138]
MNSIRPTTTPTLYVSIDEDITSYKLELTVQNKHIKLVYAGDQLTAQATENGCLITCTLPQEDTRALIPGTQAKVQLRASKGTEVIATSIGSISIDEILNYQEI